MDERDEADRQQLGWLMLEGLVPRIYQLWEVPPDCVEAAAELCRGLAARIVDAPELVMRLNAAADGLKAEAERRRLV